MEEMSRIFCSWKFVVAHTACSVNECFVDTVLCSTSAVISLICEGSESEEACLGPIRKQRGWCIDRSCFG